MVVISSFDICFIDDLPLPGSDWPSFNTLFPFGIFLVCSDYFFFYSVILHLTILTTGFLPATFFDFSTLLLYFLDFDCKNLIFETVLLFLALEK